jgi:hypothetical protein
MFLLYQGILTGKILQHEILYFQCIKTVHDAATSNQVPSAPSNNLPSIKNNLKQFFIHHYQGFNSDNAINSYVQW